MLIHYIDGFSQIHFINGMVRIDTFQLQPQKNSEPTKNDDTQIIMTPQTFIEALSAMQQLAEKLTENGILQRQS